MKSKSFTLSGWIKNAKESNNFDSFKLYIIKCWNDEEEFYKIGRTFLKLEDRFSNNYNNDFPYSYKVIDIVESNPFHIFKLEKKLHRQLKENKYIPIQEFVGNTECFHNIEKYYERKR